MGSILKVRDSTTGEWINIPAIIGPKGEDGTTGPKGDTGAPGKDAPQESILYIPQELTKEQQTQARVNIGANEIVLLDFTVEEEVLEIFLPLDEYKEDINNSTEMILYTQLKMPTTDEATALGTIKADIGWRLGEFSDFYDTSNLLKNDVILPTNSITYIDSVTVVSHIYKSPNALPGQYGPLGYTIKVIHKNNQPRTVDMASSSNRLIPADKTAELKITASHNIGLGSQFKLAIRR